MPFGELTVFQCVSVSVYILAPVTSDLLEPISNHFRSLQKCSHHRGAELDCVYWCGGGDRARHQVQAIDARRRGAAAAAQVITSTAHP